MPEITHVESMEHARHMANEIVDKIVGLASIYGEDAISDLASFSLMCDTVGSLQAYLQHTLETEFPQMSRTVLHERSNDARQMVLQALRSTGSSG